MLLGLGIASAPTDNYMKKVGGWSRTRSLSPVHADGYICWRMGRGLCAKPIHIYVFKAHLWWEAPVDLKTRV